MNKNVSLSPLSQCSIILNLLIFGTVVLFMPAFGTETLPDSVTVEAASSLTHQI